VGDGVLSRKQKGKRGKTRRTQFVPSKKERKGEEGDFGALAGLDPAAETLCPVGRGGEKLAVLSGGKEKKKSRKPPGLGLRESAARDVASPWKKKGGRDLFSRVIRGPKKKEKEKSGGEVLRTGGSGPLIPPTREEDAYFFLLVGEGRG